MKRELTEDQLAKCKAFGEKIDELVDLTELIPIGLVASVAENFDDDIATLIAKLALENVPEDYVDDIEAVLVAVATDDLSDLEEELEETLSDLADQNLPQVNDDLKEIGTKLLTMLVITLLQKFIAKKEVSL